MIIKKIADWFSVKGGVVLIAKILYYFALLLTIIVPLLMLILGIVLGVNYENPVLIAVLVPSAFLFLIIMIVFDGFALGLAQFVEQIYYHLHHNKIVAAENKSQETE